MKLFKQRRGQAVLVGLMCAIIVLIFLTQMITPLKVFIGQARTDLGCADMASLSVGTRSACVLTDFYMPYILGAGLAVAVAYITRRQIVQVQG